ncbi:MAG: rod shape-determining protein [Sulfurospirillaceae bacterium]|nr:rod shape-determining protein [Sulfurospirillaceae bacterium]
MLFQHKYFAIDLGTNNTLVYEAKRGIIFDEPTSISFDKKRASFFDFGLTSKNMYGKNPKNIEILQPLSKGAIANITVAKAYIKNLISSITKHSLLKPDIVVSVPSDLNAMERHAVIEAGREGGARRVLLLKDPFSAAIGSLKDISYSKGLIVLDIGAGVSEITLLSCNGIVMSKSLRVAGNDLDEAIIEYFKTNKRIQIGLLDAEILKKELAFLGDNEEKTMTISVKNLMTRMPEHFTVSSHDINRAIEPLVERIAALVYTLLSQLPATFANDIYDNGILLTGGTSLLKGLDTYLSAKLEIATHIVDTPLQNIILGAGRVMEDKQYSSLLSK